MYGGTKIVPVGKTAFKRTRSLLGRTVDRYKQKFPRVFQFINFAAGVLNLTLYFLDVYTDMRLCWTFSRYGNHGWFSIMACFIAVPYIVAIGGIFYYWWTKDADPFTRFFLVVLCPFLPIFFDVMMPFYKVCKPCLPKGIVTFMVQYEATRTLSENWLESVPQMGLQVYLFYYCNEDESVCTGITKEGGEILLFSLFVSIASVLFHFAKMYFEMKKEGLSLKGYVRSLLTMGAGVPLKAIANNRIEELSLCGEKLLPENVALLSNALKHNTSLRRADLRSCGIDDEGAKHLSLALAENATLVELWLEDNEISDEGLGHISLALKKNTALKTLRLQDNNIGDAGIDHIIGALPEGVALENLFLYSNSKISESKKRELKETNKTLACHRIKSFGLSDTRF